MWRIEEISAFVINYQHNFVTDNGVRVQFVAHRESFCTFYYITAQLCDVRTVFDCNMWRIVETSVSVIT
jgi:hypothetical protein